MGNPNNLTMNVEVKQNFGFSPARVRVIKREFRRREMLRWDPAVDNNQLKASRAQQVRHMLRNEVTSVYVETQ